MNTRKMRMAALVLAIGLSGTAQAALQGRDLNGSIASFEAYYDTDLNITWLADANYAHTSGYDTAPAANGAMTWNETMTWVENLSFTDGVNVYTNWRLPNTLIPDPTCGQQSVGVSNGYGCTGSEIGHLYYEELGGVAGSSLAMTHNTNIYLFQNILPVQYWSSTPITGTYFAWSFHMNGGAQNMANIFDTYSYYAWAVSDGDVGIAAVPEPETYAMILAGLVMVGAAARRRRG